jgi:phosphoglycerol transferase
MVKAEDIAPPIKKKNCIIILAESFENSFNGEQTDFNLIPNLKSLQDENISFKNQIQTVGTGYTIGAMTGHIFGLPLILPFQKGNLYEFFKHLLPNATGIFEILEYNNYQINVVMGSDIYFAGQNKFFTNHTKNTTIFDSNSFIANNEHKDPKNCYDESFWGFCDLFVLNKAKIIVNELAKSDKPFFSLIVTIDTHSPTNTYAENPKIFDDARDAFIFSDSVISNFIDWLKLQDFYKDTVVIILGDHNYMSNQIGNFKISDNIKRTLYNVFINTDISPQDIDRERLCTTLDLAPTILQALGFSLPKDQYGLGVSLFSKKKTLVEEYGLLYLNQELSKKSVLYESFFK